MLLTDTHLHLYADEYGSEVNELLNKADKKNIKRFLLPNIDLDSISGLLQLSKQFPGICFPMMGLHPCYVKENYKEALQVIETTLRSGKFCAVGEIGIDLYWDKSTQSIQEDAFRIQCEWAMELNLPVAIHCRDSFDRTADLIQELQQKNNHPLRGVFHCFTGTADQARRAIALGFYLGIGGVLTFKNSGLDKVLSEIPVDFLLLETDGPYLAPVPFRGKRNDPEYLYLVAQKLAEVKQLHIPEIAKITSDNATRLFALS